MKKLGQKKPPSSVLSPASGRQRKPATDYLLETRLKGDRKREQFLEQFASQSAKKLWSEQQCHIEAFKAAMTVVLNGRLPARGSVETFVIEARAAGHPDVRSEFGRLMTIRNDVWDSHKALAQKLLHGPSQTLMNLVYLQRDPDRRHHAASTRAYLRYLHDRETT